MRVLFAVAGILLVLVVMLDVFWTTMGIGGGVMTKRVSSRLWKAVLTSYRVWNARLLLTWAGIAILMLAVTLWILMLWAGWTLIFSAVETAVVNGQTRLPADPYERIYFTGYTLFTLGIGDYVPQGGLWRVLTAVAALNGLFLVTFSITYLVPIVQAATHMRQVSVYIASIGLTPQDLLRRTRDGDDCSGLASHLSSLISEIVHLQQRYLTYPVLHYFHSLRRPAELTLSLAALDEALTILAHATDDRCGVPPSVYNPMRQVMTEFLSTLRGAFINPADAPPPPPSLAVLRAEGLPVTVRDDAFRARVAELADRRCLLLGLVRNSGWEWSEIEEQPEAHAGATPLHEIPRVQEPSS